MPGFAEALAAADAKADHAERGKAFDAVNQIIAEQVPVVPLAFNVVGAACSKNVVGYQPSILIDEFRGVGLAK
jgi:peptide/nickel transport system substrate-binding protein